MEIMDRVEVLIIPQVSDAVLQRTRNLLWKPQSLSGRLAVGKCHRLGTWIL